MEEGEAIKYLVIGSFGLIALLALFTFLKQPITIPYVGEITVFTAIIIVVGIIAFSVLIALFIKLIETAKSFFQ